MPEWKMDMWKYYAITHRHHLFCNPISRQKADGLIDLLDLKTGARVLDIACGKGEMLVCLAERYGISGVGVDLSPFFIAEDGKKHMERVPRAKLEWMHMDGAAYKPDRPESFDLTMCIGASWVFNGHRGTLQALKGMTMPGGLVLVGEPFWLKEPDPEYLAFDGLSRDLCSSNYGNVAIGEEEGLVPLYSTASDQDDFDRYEALQWYAAAEYASAHPDDPDVPEILAHVTHWRETHLRWGRDTMSWALYLFRKSLRE